MTAALPSIRDAKLPRAYVDALAALERCAKLDECEGWADREAALASYARQTADDSLRKLATKIQARAIRRCGKLLKQRQENAKQEAHATTSTGHTLTPAEWVRSVVGDEVAAEIQARLTKGAQ